MNEVFKALSHPARRRMVAMLRKGPMSSGDIAAGFDMAWPTVTAHLAALKSAGLVETERDGTTVRYRLVISAAEEAIGFLMQLTGAGDDMPDPAPAAPDAGSGDEESKP